jgi:hypothetical protein
MMLPETDAIKAAKAHAHEIGVDLGSAKHRARKAIKFIEARGLDIDGKLDQWHKEAILELFEIGPEEAMLKSEPTTALICGVRFFSELLCTQKCTQIAICGL